MTTPMREIWASFKVQFQTAALERGSLATNNAARGLAAATVGANAAASALPRVGAAATVAAAGVARSTRSATAATGALSRLRAMAISSGAALRGAGASATGAMGGFRGLLGPIVALATLGGARSLVGGLTELGDDLDKTSQRLGLTTDDLQRWRHAAELSGVSSDDLTSAVGRLQRSMFDADRGSALARDAVERLGVSVTDASGELKGADQILRDIADPIAAIESPTERAAILMTIMGRSGSKMAPLFARGRDGVEQMTAELDSLGLVSNESIKASVELADAQTRLSAAWDGAKSKIGVVLLPALTKLAGAFTELLTGSDNLSGAAEKLKVVLTALGVIAAAAGVKMALAWAAALWPFVLLGALIAGVILVVQDLITWIEGGDSVIGRMLDSWKLALDSMAEQPGFLGWLAGSLRNVLALSERVRKTLGDVFGIDVQQTEAQASEEASAERFAAQQQRRVFGRGVAGIFDAAQAGGRRAEGSTMRTALLDADSGASQAARGIAAARANVVNQDVRVITTSTANPSEIERAARRAMSRAQREAREAMGQ